ncbi:MAG: ribosome biogenesis GTPase YlqF [Bacillota bacterium]
MKQYYPGHMEKGKHTIRRLIAHVDLVAEVCDARIPRSSRNPDLAKWTSSKRRVIILNRKDLADPEATQLWLSALARAGEEAIASDGNSGEGLSELERVIRHGLRVMVVGIPNVGKSSIINRLARRRKAPTGMKVGVTRGLQWIRLPGGAMLLDLPGILRPKIGSAETRYHLAIAGLLPEDVYDVEEVAELLLAYLRQRSPESLARTYGGYTLESVGRSRGYLLPGDRVDPEKSARAVIHDFRAGKLGTFTLEMPEEETDSGT